VIAAMEKVLVAGRTLDRRAVLEAIRGAGVVHVEPVERRESIALPAVREALAMAGRALDILATVEAPAASCHPEHTPPVVIERVLALASKLEQTKLRRQDLLVERQQAAPWGRLGAADLQALLAAGLRVEFFTCPAGAAGAVRAEIRHLAGSIKGQEHWVAVSRGQIVVEAPANRVPMPARDAAAIDRALGALVAEETRLAGEISSMRPCRGDLRKHLLHLQDQQRLLEVESGLHEAGEIFVLKGWVPSRDAAGLAASLDGLAVPMGLQVSPPDELDQPPTRFENPAWCRPIENLYRLLGVFPGYREKDISFLFLPALTVFTGFLIADAGYAACALLALALSYRPLVSRGAPADDRVVSRGHSDLVDGSVIAPRNPDGSPLAGSGADAVSAAPAGVLAR
jgi:V/A-type H+-transporting ATPase subunit I